MENVVLTIHLILALALIGIVLLQRSEGGALGMGGGGTGSMAARSHTAPVAHGAPASHALHCPAAEHTAPASHPAPASSCAVTTQAGFPLAHDERPTAQAFPVEHGRFG